MKRLLFIFSLFSVALNVNATKYYISNSVGNDAYSGLDMCNPWKTINKVNNFSFLPGDSVLFRSGDEWREMLVIPSSGIQGKPITYTSYGLGGKPIFNGADIKLCWVKVGTNLYATNSTGYITNHIMVIINNVIFEEVATQAALTSTGKYFIKTAATPDSVFVYSAYDPNLVVSQVSKREYGIYGSPQKLIHHVVISNLEARYAGGGGLVLDGNGSPFNGSVVVDKCNFYANRKWGCMTRDRHDNDIFKNSSATYNGNGFYAWISDGNQVLTCSTANSIHYKIGNGFTDGGAIQNFQGRDWLVENCYSTNDNDAIHIDAGGVSTNAIIRYNKVFLSKFGNGSPHTPGMGVGSLGAGAIVQIYYNLIVNCAQAGFESYTPMQGRVEFFNNTIYNRAGTGVEATFLASHATNFLFRNNIYAREGTDNRPLYEFITANTANSDYNLFYSGVPYRWFNNYVNYSSLAAWQAGTGNDLNSIVGNPMFVNVGNDWSLQTGSPAINTGTNVGLTRDITGKLISGNPDMGCYEK